MCRILLILSRLLIYISFLLSTTSYKCLVNFLLYGFWTSYIWKRRLNLLTTWEVETSQMRQEWAALTRITWSFQEPYTPNIKGIHILRGEMGCQSCDNSRLLSKSHSLHYCTAVMRILTALPSCSKVPIESWDIQGLKCWLLWNNYSSGSADSAREDWIGGK